jgi:hypothetical protein
LLADAVHTTGTLDQADDSPRQIVVDDHEAVLEILAFAENVRGHQHSQFGSLLQQLNKSMGSMNRAVCLPVGTLKVTQEHQKALDTSIHNRLLAGHAHCAGEGAELSRRVDVESEGY